MQAAVFRGEGRLVLEERPEPVIEAPDDVIVAVEACGICGSDLQILNVPPGHKATPGTILGHEFVGRVTAVGLGAAAAGVWLGQRVVVDPGPRCGTCGACRTGKPAHCRNILALGVDRDGGLAANALASAAFVYPIRDDVPAERAVLVEPLACVINATNLASIRPGQSAVVFGAGATGCLFTAVFKASGASPIVIVEPSPRRASVARAVGADEVLPPDEFAARLDEFLPGGADVVVDAVGSVLAPAIAAAAMGGRIVLFGMNDTARPAIQQVMITEKGLTIIGTFTSPFTFPTAIRLVESDAIDLAPIVSDVMPLERTLEGIARLRSGDATKIVIVP